MSGRHEHWAKLDAPREMAFWIWLHERMTSGEPEPPHAETIDIVSIAHRSGQDALEARIAALGLTAEATERPDWVTRFAGEEAAGSEYCAAVNESVGILTDALDGRDRAGALIGAVASIGAAQRAAYATGRGERLVLTPRLDAVEPAHPI